MEALRMAISSVLGLILVHLSMDWPRFMLQAKSHFLSSSERLQSEVDITLFRVASLIKAAKTLALFAGKFYSE